jgi:Kef-type K+ transport system membrane component KefB
MGEMIAGIVLGPSVLGLIIRRRSTFLFPASSLETLRLLSQIGVVLFMFIVGMELNVSSYEKKDRRGDDQSREHHRSFSARHALSLFLYRELAPPGTSFMHLRYSSGLR